ncbi:uncharacterized protein LOC106169969 isoform X2 [Lingula anatina]|uniref:S-methyl-5-thioribose kinase n=1 Tax=Lingula anatina TaxID=7574 RepID=A0A1S3J4B6_LINAN|nr:uncharacterized protein LOC106169969 isoform X1 [Lingula anatina]XP_013405106.1 uncharacterized protein LOC106169969 isoform X2 [Lingula anatina]|eukprot:XP_013405105.1 uncharacterized protein LOC106169969 isoform X1 [Lingula anatina]
MQVMGEKLDTEKIQHILRKCAPLPGLECLDGSEDIELEEIGDGNINDVFRVTSVKERSQSLVVKHGPAYIKCLGPEFPLSIVRLKVEYNALAAFQRICPGYSPCPYYFDVETNAVLMEDLRDHSIMRKELISGNINMETVKKIAYFLACVHRDTHVSKLSEAEFEKLQQDFQNEDMVSLTRQYIFTRPFDKTDPTNRCSEAVQKKLHLIYEDPGLLDSVWKMRNLFLEKKECLVHGDLHTGSVLVSNNSAKVFDNEFAYVGPAAFDLGLLIANYIFSYYRHMSTQENHDTHRKFSQKLIEACYLTVNTYLSVMTCTVGQRHEYLNNLLTETAGFAGCEIIRRIIGTAHVEDLEGIPYAEEDALEAGVRLLLGHDRIHTIDRLMVIALMLT